MCARTASKGNDWGRTEDPWPYAEVVSGDGALHHSEDGSRPNSCANLCDRTFGAVSNKRLSICQGEDAAPPQAAQALWCCKGRMDPRIRNLASTTFGGERLSRPAIAEIQETVQFFPELSRSELARTVCEQMGWHTPGGATRLAFGLRMLGELERLGIVRLPAKRGPGQGRQKPLQFDHRTAPQPTLQAELGELAPVRLETASKPAEAALWNQWVQRYHPLGYRQPMGAHLPGTFFGNY